jgi:hypothetical protein
MMSLRTLHTAVGTLFVAAFLYTGAYLQLQFPESHDGNDTIRMMFRANHVYILMASLTNLGFGCYLITSSQGVTRWLQTLGSALVALSPLMLLIAFFTEPLTEDMDRTTTVGGVLALMVGVVIHIACSIRRVPGVASSRR